MEAQIQRGEDKKAGEDRGREGEGGTRARTGDRTSPASSPALPPLHPLTSISQQKSDMRHMQPLSARPTSSHISSSSSHSLLLTPFSAPVIRHTAMCRFPRPSDLPT